MPWLDANGISIHYQLAGEGPSLVLLHEMGGTLDSWDGLFSALSQRFRVLRYDQRGSGLSEKVRQPITTELLVADLAAVLQGLALAPPYHFVTVAAATMQALLYLTRSPEHIASFVFCNPFTGADPSRVAALDERAGWPGVRACARQFPSPSTSHGPRTSVTTRPTRLIARAISHMIRCASRP